jgi:N-alpha-acetyltransferase 15/16, NatA auxiliary subunit
MLEEGDAHLRRGNLGLALRRYKSVQMASWSFGCLPLLIRLQTFDEVENDQFDFHNYSLRRFTMNTYLKYALPCVV